MRHGTTGRGAALDVYIRATRRAGRTALDAVARVGEGRRVAAGLRCLAERHADNTNIITVRERRERVIIVAASEGGAWSGRRAEVQVPVTWSPDRPGDPLVDEEADTALLYVSGSDGAVHRYELPLALGAWALAGALDRCGELIACRTGLVPACEVGGYLDPVHGRAGRGLFRALGMQHLFETARQDGCAWNRDRGPAPFAPAPERRPLVLGRERPWSAEDYVPPAGRTVTDPLDLPARGAVCPLWIRDGARTGITVPVHLDVPFGCDHPVIEWERRETSPLTTALADAWIICAAWASTLREAGATTADDGAITLTAAEKIRYRRTGARCWRRHRCGLMTILPEEDEEPEEDEDERAEEDGPAGAQGDDIPQWERDLLGL